MVLVGNKNKLKQWKYPPTLLSSASSDNSVAYQTKVLTYSPIAFWPMNETSGTNVNCLVNAAQDGTYVGVTLNQATGPQGGTAGLWDKVNDGVEIYSSALNTAFNGDEGSMLIWFLANVWNSGYMLSIESDSGTDYNWLTHDTRVKSVFRRSSSLFKNSAVIPIPVVWNTVALTWSWAAKEVKAYYQGSQISTTGTPAAQWSGNLVNSNANAIGARLGGSLFGGNLSNAMIFDTVLSGADLLDLSVVL